MIYIRGGKKNMEIEEKLKNDAKNNPDFLWISGSNLYGTNVINSDMDLRGFIIPPFEYLIGVNKFESIEFTEEDHKIYSLKYFIELVLKGDPLAVEGLFAPQTHIKILSERGSEILALKEDMISMNLFKRIFGYSISEWRKAMAIKIVSEKKPKEKFELIEDIRNLYSPNKETMDSIVDILDSMDAKKVVPSLSGIGEKRKEDVEKYGYCRKSACHAIRLLDQLSEIMLTGKITFPRPNAEFLKDIRNGKYSKKELEEIYLHLSDEVDSKKGMSILPEKPNAKKVWDEYKRIVGRFLMCDTRFQKMVIYNVES